MIAAQLYTVRDRLHDRRQLVEVLGRLREIGYEGVEVASLGPDAADHFSEELTRAASRHAPRTSRWNASPPTCPRWPAAAAPGDASTWSSRACRSHITQPPD